MSALPRHIVTLQHVARRNDDVRSELAPVIENLREDLDPTMSKSQAAQVIGVSVPTLDKWIARGLLPVQRAESGRPRVMRDPVLALAGQVDDLRRAGQDRHLIATVVDRMQRDDENYQRDFAELYGPGLVALAESDLVSAAPGSDWHPED
jgi:DNA-binding transcriptional MerR regulator